MDLFRIIGGDTTYAIWWLIADAFPEFMYFCELMIRLICHGSKLKCDDVTLKAGPRNSRICSNCHHNCIDNAKHMVIQCDDTQVERDDMMNEIYMNTEEEAHLVQNTMDLFPVLLGKKIEGMSDTGMLNIWVIAGTYIYKMYQSRTRVEVGIG